jgi:hypothetical protein
VRFIGHFVRVYESSAPAFASDSLRWSADPSNIQTYIQNGRRMNDVLGLQLEQAESKALAKSTCLRPLPYRCRSAECVEITDERVAATSWVCQCESQELVSHGRNVRPPRVSMCALGVFCASGQGRSVPTFCQRVVHRRTESNTSMAGVLGEPSAFFAGRQRPRC